MLAPACISTDHPRHLSFVPAAPTEASILFDLVVGASSIYAGSWVEGAGAVFAENEALRWISELAGLPPEAGGVFVSGGTAGNLSALLAARWKWRADAGGAFDRTRGLIIGCDGAHSSVAQAAKAMDADIVLAPADDRGRLTATAIDATIEGLTEEDRRRVFAVVATSGTTNAGVVDDLAAAADAAERLGTWLHVDGAYGGAGLAAPSVRHLFAGVERADSFIVDPHKWLFAPFDSCALVYRDPEIARHAHTQHAEYLDVLHDDHDHASAAAGWNTSDYAHHLTRRARGLPFWFSLATYGTDAYATAIETTLQTTRAGARLVDEADHLELILEPELSIVLFRRPGWTASDYQAWSDELLRARRSIRDAHHLGRRDRAALVHRQPGDHRRRPRRDRRHADVTDASRHRAPLRLPDPAEMRAIVVVGSMMIDQITYCERVPEEGETLVAIRYEQGFGGKGANQAVMAARLGAPVAMLGCVGDDDLGQATVANLESNGVDAECVSTVAGCATGVAPIWVDQHGANRILIAPGANDALEPAMIEFGFARRDDVAVVLAQLETPQAATREAFRLASERSATTVLNPAPAATIDESLLDLTDWLIPNESEYELLFGCPPDAGNIANDARDRPYGLIVTMGSAGAVVSDRLTTSVVSAPPAREVIDTTGAGDAFVGAFAAGLAAGLEPVEAARLGCVAGSLAVRAAGTQRSFPSRRDVDNEISLNERKEP